ncbi:MAG TPA: hypothetical protein VK797_14525 [Tepidisphaeraceae bacterium]|nr:hypothetical protein [Tepidisphaeraceae bacterium]
MRKFYKILAVTGLAAIPVVWVSAQQFPSRQDSPQARQFDFSGAPPARDSFSGRAQPETNQANASANALVTYTVQPLPREFALLNSRSIFSKDHLAVSTDHARPIFSGTQSSLFFRGIMKEGNHFLANIEDSSSNKTEWVSIGSMLTFNGARITEITFDHIVVDRGGTARQIGVGESLDGGKSVPQPAVTPAVTAGVAPSAKNAPTAAASTAGTASEDTILEAMKARRLKELGQ